MGRWEPGADARLREAALRLFEERGYDQATVADVAAVAGLTPRTFFRHYADKREVLFAGWPELRAHVVGALVAAPSSSSPLEAVAAALDAAAQWLDFDRDFSRRRQAIIESSSELRERELIKFADLSDALDQGLRGRGVTEPRARIAAETGVTVLRVAFQEWLDDPQGRSLREHVTLTLSEVADVARPGSRRRPG